MNYLKKFQTNLAYHFSEVLEHPFAKPRWIYIGLSHKCTYSCQMCEVVKILKEHELPNDTVKKALNEISGWGWDCTIMFTGGEPFLRRDIFELIEHSVKMNLKTEVVSNGSLVNGPLAYKIVSSGLENVAISLDGSIESTHDSIREKGSFKKAINAIENLVKAKKKLGKGPQISVWTTIMKENVKELSDIISLVRNLGVECLVYHPVIVVQDDMQSTSSNAPFWIKGDSLKTLKEQIDKIVDYQAKNGLVVFLHDPYLLVKYFEGGLNRQYWKCNPFAFINIGPDGEVRSCGSDFGNVKEIKLNECFLTEDAHKARKMMKLCQKPCLQTCWAYPEADSLSEIANTFVADIKKSKDKPMLLKEALKMIEKYENTLIEYKNA